jgi:hypothetical protein
VLNLLGGRGERLAVRQQDARLQRGSRAEPERHERCSGVPEAAALLVLASALSRRDRLERPEDTALAAEVACATAAWAAATAAAPVVKSAVPDAPGLRSGDAHTTVQKIQ